MANYFKEDESRPILSAWIEQGFVIDRAYVLEAVETDRNALEKDTQLSTVATFGSIASGCLMLALSGLTAPMIIPIAMIGAASLTAWNSDCAKSDRELEAKFLRAYPTVFDRLAQRISAGEETAKIASDYGLLLKAYRRADRTALASLVDANTQTLSVQDDKPEIQLQQGFQNNDNHIASRVESGTLVETELQPIAIAQDVTTAAAPSSISVKPGDSIGLDLASVLLAMPEFCHILLAGENGTGKTTFAMALLKPVINKFIQITGFELLLIDPKRSRWNGLFQTKSYQSAFSNQPHDLERSVNRLERIYFKLDKLSSDRQKTGHRTEVPTLVIIDEVNTWLDALKAFDRNFKEENASLPVAERSPAPRLYNRAVDSIAGISRMGREDRVWLWLIGQNSNLEALGLSGAQDRANFSIVAVGLGDNQITIELALSNSTMFTRGQALKNALKEHQGKPYQIAACTRKPANLLIMPSSYKDNAQDDFSAEILARLGGLSPENQKLSQGQVNWEFLKVGSPGHPNATDAIEIKPHNTTLTELLVRQDSENSKLTLPEPWINQTTVEVENISKSAYEDWQDYPVHQAILVYIQGKEDKTDRNVYDSIKKKIDTEQWASIPGTDNMAKLKNVLSYLSTTKKVVKISSNSYSAVS